MFDWTKQLDRLDRIDLRAAAARVAIHNEDLDCLAGAVDAAIDALECIWEAIEEERQTRRIRPEEDLGALLDQLPPEPVD